MGIYTEDIKSFLKDVEINEKFLDVELGSFFQAEYLESIFDICEVISNSIILYEEKMEAYEKPDAEKYLDPIFRGIPLEEGAKTQIPKYFRPRKKVVDHLINIFGCDQEFVAYFVRDFQIETKKQAEKLKRSIVERNWERKFVQYFTDKIENELDQNNIEGQLSSNNYSQEEMIRNRRKLKLIITSLLDRFKLDTKKSYPDNWNPPSHLITHLHQHGLERKYSYCKPIIASFRNECKKLGIPRSKANIEYMKYLKNHEKELMAVAK